MPDVLCRRTIATMRRLVCVAVALLLLSLPVRAGEASAAAHGISVSIDVLSDTKAVDLRPYLNVLTSSLRKQWMERVADARSESSMETRETLIELTLAEDGRIVALRQQGGSHDENWTHIVWNVAKDHIYSPLPEGLKSANLVLRLHFTDAE